MDLFARLRSSFVTGLFLVLPLTVTLFVLDLAVDRLTATLAPVVRGTGLAVLVGNVALATALAVVLVALGVTLLGFLVSHEAGRRLFGGFERGVRLLPVVRAVYFGVRQVSESLASPGSGYDRVALVEYPQPGRYRLGFVTGRAPRELDDAAATDDGRVHSVFLPNSPNPTAGVLALVPESELRELDVSVRRGLRLLITTGLSAEEEELEADPVGKLPSDDRATGEDGSVTTGDTTDTGDAATPARDGRD